MAARLNRPLFGWDGPARGLLIVTAAACSVGLAWVSRGSGPAGEVAVPTLFVDANAAPLAVLGALPGLGPVLSGRIVAARQIRPFRSIDDFDRRVSGIGPAKVAALRPFLRFEIPPAP